jgi:hypothetical protein
MMFKEIDYLGEPLLKPLEDIREIKSREVARDDAENTLNRFVRSHSDVVRIRAFFSR